MEKSPEMLKDINYKQISGEMILWPVTIVIYLSFLEHFLLIFTVEYVNEFLFVPLEVVEEDPGSRCRDLCHTINLIYILNHVLHYVLGTQDLYIH